MKKTAWNAIEWTPEMDRFLVNNFHFSTNSQIAKALGLKITSVRTRAYKFGLQRMKQEKWTDEQISFLKSNYKKIGDTEMAEIFESKWYKEKGWSKKHIEKKRRQMQLKRTNEERSAIKQRNLKRGCWDDAHRKRWHKKAAPIGAIKIWKHYNRERPFIKTEKGYEFLSRFMWEYHNGPISKGYNVFHIDGNPLNCKINNLKLISNAELSIENSPSKRMTDNWVAGILSHGQKEFRKEIKNNPQLIELKRAQLKLNRKIKEHEH